MTRGRHGDAIAASSTPPRNAAHAESVAGSSRVTWKTSKKCVNDGLHRVWKEAALFNIAATPTHTHTHATSLHTADFEGALRFDS